MKIIKSKLIIAILVTLSNK